MAHYYRFIIPLLLLERTHCFEEDIGKPGLFKGEKDGRMVNGEEAPKHMYPYVALIQYFRDNSYWYSYCHGIITDPYTILTVNYCASIFIKQGQHPRVVAGAHKIKEMENTKQIRAICKAEAFAPTNNSVEFKNTYAVLHLSEPFVFNSFVTSINLPVPGIDVSQVHTPCWFVSWGKWEESHQDRFVQPRHKGVDWTPCSSETTHNSVLCSEGDVCTDLGAPVVCVTKENYFFAKALAVTSKNHDCESEGLYANLVTMDYGWYTTSVENAKSFCRVTEHLRV